MYALHIFLSAVLFEATLAGFSNLRTTTVDGIELQSQCNDFLPLAKYLPIGSNYYLIEGQVKTNWHIAADHCRANNADLANIESAEELAALSKYLLEKGYDKTKWFWIDGNDLGKEGQFHSLTTGKQMTYVKWSASQPDNNGNNENCVHLWLQGQEFQMNDWQCSQQAFFICKARQPKTIAFTVW